MKLETRVPRPVRSARRVRIRPPQVFAQDRAGLVPGSPGGTSQYLRADGTWAEVATPPVTAVRLATDHEIASTTATRIDGLAIGLGVGTYTFQYFLICQSTDVLVGLAFGVNFTGSIGHFSAARRYFSTGAAAATGIMDDVSAVATGALVEHNSTRALSTTAPNLGPNTGVAAADQDCLNVIEGVVQATDVGTLELWHASSAATQTSVEAGSMMIVTRAG